jgi:non-specific serine/threonine protein kinase
MTQDNPLQDHTKCTECGFENPQGSATCARCEAQLSSPVDLEETKAFEQVDEQPAPRISPRKYRVLRRMGRGGMGEVYEAQDTKLGRTVALKFLSPGLTGDSEARKQFVTEARAASALDHPNICTIYEIDETEDNQMFISMAYYSGETLREILRAGPLDLVRGMEIGIHIAEGLTKAHSKGIVHRDIKPGNIFITTDGQVKILDFGLAKLTGETGEVSIEPRGTVLYMSPEQVRGDGVDRRADIWSLGAVLYEMITGSPPFTGKSAAEVMDAIVNAEPAAIKEVRPDLAVDPDSVVGRALRKDVESRYQTMDELLDRLTALVRQIKTKKKGFVPSIAVLPFVDLSATKDQDYLCEGIAEELINGLAKVSNLRVVSRTSAFKYKNSDLDIRDIGRQLNVYAILEGSVKMAGNTLRVTAQLIDVESGYHLWSDRYDRQPEDIFAIEDEIAQNIVEALKLTLTREEKRSIQPIATTDIQAYDYYLRGRKFYYQYRRRDIEIALEMFTLAIKHDPDYAPAHAGVADCCAFLFLYAERSQESIERAYEASRKALDLDPGLAKAHASHGQVLTLLQRHKEAEVEFETAIRLDPKLFEAYYFYGRDCFAQGKLDKAAELFERSSEVSPDDYQAPLLVAQIYDALQQKDRAAATRRRGVEIVRDRLRLNPGDIRALYMGANALVALGESDKGLEWASLALTMDPNDPMVLYNVGCIYSMVGRIEDALDCLERAEQAGLSQREWYEHDSNLDPLRDLPRFKILLEKLK